VDKIYKLSKVKRHENQDDTFVPVGSSWSGSFPFEPTEGNPFTFFGTRGLNDCVSTSIVKEIDTEVEPGVTYIITLNSVYKLEEVDV
jgi:hypothetical protein